MPGYLIDELSWRARQSVTVDLPLHAPVAPCADLVWQPAVLDVEGAPYLRDVERASALPRGAVALHRAGDELPVGWLLGTDEQEWWRAVAPGAPGRPLAAMHLVRLSGAAGTLRILWSWRGVVADARLDGDAVHVRLADGTAHAHARAAHGWHVDLAAGEARSSIDLGGLVAASHPPSVVQAPAAPPPAALSLATPRRFALGEAHYRRSEPGWRDAGAPTATVELSLAAHELIVHVEVRKASPSFVPAGAVNDMDNERPDINGDGVQLHLAGDPPPADSAGALGWLLVPELAGGVRVIALTTATTLPLAASWTRTPAGYALSARISLSALRAYLAPGGHFRLDVLVNESAPGRERRRGQLVLGGVSPGERVYLRGDRHDLRRAPTFALPDV
jgi:hypothetical protein